MATDIVIRTAGRCLTVVTDHYLPDAEAIEVMGQQVSWIMKDGKLPIGTLNEEMAKHAKECVIAVGVLMKGPFVSKSRTIALIVE